MPSLTLRDGGNVADLSCPRCGGRYGPGDFNVGQMVAICRSCGQITTIEAPVARETPAGGGRETPPEDLMALVGGPRGITVSRGPESLVLRRRWLSFGVVPLAFFAVIWNTFLVFWYTAALSSDKLGADAVMMLVFPLLHVGVGIGIGYRVLADLFNSTTITVDDSHLTVRNGPLPWRSPEPVPTGAVDQLYLLLRRGSKGAPSYEVMVRLKDRTARSLGKVANDEQARFIEKRIEAYLGIADVPVAGEYDG